MYKFNWYRITWRYSLLYSLIFITFIGNIFHNLRFFFSFVIIISLIFYYNVQLVVNATRNDTIVDSCFVIFLVFTIIKRACLFACNQLSVRYQAILEDVNRLALATIYDLTELTDRYLLMMEYNTCYYLLALLYILI